MDFKNYFWELKSYDWCTVKVFLLFLEECYSIYLCLMINNKNEQGYGAHIVNQDIALYVYLSPKKDKSMWSHDHDQETWSGISHNMLWTCLGNNR